jgi:hypothetical protein
MDNTSWDNRHNPPIEKGFIRRLRTVTITAWYANLIHHKKQMRTWSIFVHLISKIIQLLCPLFFEHSFKVGCIGNDRWNSRILFEWIQISFKVLSSIVWYWNKWLICLIRPIKYFGLISWLNIVKACFYGNMCFNRFNDILRYFGTCVNRMMNYLFSPYHLINDIIVLYSHLPFLL